MYLGVIVACLAAVIVGYFFNNPMGHSRRFILRRFLNWFPLGMTYSFLYMGRYNLNVSKNALGSLMSKEDFGLIFGLGTLVYAVSFLVNGPLVDRIGGRKGILIAGFGSAAANVLLGLLTMTVLAGWFRGHLVATYTALYGLNMYFQSYGAVSIIKVKAYWFHVRERGVFGAIFGTLISIGVYFAFDWGQGIVNFTGSIPAVFFVPAAIIACWSVVDLWAVADTPEDVGFPAFDTHDASSGLMHVHLTYLDLLKKVFASRLMLMIAVIELTSGIFRNGISQWYFVFANEVRQPGAGFFLAHWGWLLCIFGIVGGFAAGFISDKCFQSRRGPPAAMLCGLVLVLSLMMAATLRFSPVLVGVSGVAIVMCSVGLTSLMSGTAATDFGGRKATATCAGVVDGFAYLGSSIQSFSIGYIATHNWNWWPLFLTPFAAIGLAIAVKIRLELPPATRRYIAEVEGKRAGRTAGALEQPAKPAFGT
jgi:MFS transporter, OPA family, glycerol-3-phosphate transporter